MSDSIKKKKHLFLVDGYGYLFRAYHSMPPLTNPEGTPVGGVYGFTNMLMKLKNKVESAHAEEIFMLVVFDAGKKTFRNDIYPEYKANRPEPPDDLRPQFALIRDAAIALNIEVMDLVGYEADDIIATYSRIAKEQDFYTTVVSTDKDLMQLVEDEKLEMLDPMRDRKIREAEVQEKFGVLPNKVLDILSLMGDSSDNIPGVPGIGPKTAAELVNEYGSLEEVLDNAEKVKQNKRRESLIENREQAILSKKLAALEFNVPIDDASLERLQLQENDNQKLAEFLSKHGFKSMLAKVESKLDAPLKKPEPSRNISANNEESKTAIAAPMAPKNISVEVIDNEEALIKWLPEVSITKQLGLSIINDKALDGKILVLLAKSSSEACIYSPPISQENSSATNAQEAAAITQSDLFSVAPEQDNNPPSDYSNYIIDLSILAEYLKSESAKIIAFDVKGIFRELAAVAPFPTNFDDVGVMNYAVNGTSQSGKIEFLAEKYSGLELSKIDGDLLADIEANKEKLAAYVLCLLPIHERLKQDIFDNKLSNIYYSIEKPLVKVLLDMEIEGVKVSREVLEKLRTEFESKQVEISKEIFKLAGEEFNIGSPKQLGEVLFEHMGIQGGKKKAKSGAYSTDSDVLEGLAAGGHDIAAKILSWRSYNKLTTTYTNALVKEISKETGRVHSHFNNTSTSTGRLSSSKPNLQNIPIRTDYGRQIRDAFICEDGKSLVGADYSQIELRLLAHIADIEVLKNAFRNNLDIHAATAAQVFGVSLEEVTPDLRRQAKTVNFGIIYGQSAFGLAKQLMIPRGEAKVIIEKYFQQYPGIRKYMDDMIEFGREHGYVQTILGRKIHLNGINDKNGAVRQFAERLAINAPLQGTAADIIKLAMIKVADELKSKKLDAKLVLQIHDELIIECTESLAEEIVKLVEKLMAGVAQLNVPLTAEAAFGNNWGEVH